MTMNLLERSLIEKAGYENGWENVIDSREGSVVLASARHRARVRILLRPAEKGWIVEVPPGLLLQELIRSLPESGCPDGKIVAGDMDELVRLLYRTARLAVSLAALTYSVRVQDALNQTGIDTTEVQRLVKQRIGQDTFREALMDYWVGACAVTGIALPDILRASHAKPWADCESDEERLDVFNGFLLCANLDALFDRGLITFDDAGYLMCSSRLSPEHRRGLHLSEGLKLRWITSSHIPYLVWHRERVFRQGDR
jgi:hypothetical protein